MVSNFGKNAVLYAIGIAGLRAASFVLIPIYTHSLAMSDYGVLAVLLQTAQIMMIVMSLGSRTALMRLTKEYEDKNQSGTLLGTSIFINLSGAAVVTILATTFLSPLFKDMLHTPSASMYVFLTCLAAAFNCVSDLLIAYHVAGQDGMRVTVVNLAGAVALIMLTLLFLRLLHLGVQAALLAQAIIYGSVSLFLILKESRKVVLAVSLPLAWELMRYGLPFVFVMASGVIIQSSGLYFLSYFRGLEDVSIYALGTKMAQIAEMVLILPFTMAYGPFVFANVGDSRLWETISRLLTYLMIAFAFVACAIVFIARDLLPLVAPPAYGGAYFVIFLSLPALAFRGVYYIGESLLLLEKKAHLVGNVVTAVTVAGVALNYVLIWLFGMYGAIAASAFTTVCTGVAVLKLGLGMSLVRIEKQRLCMAAVLLVGFMATVYALQGASSYLYYSIVPVTVCAGTFLLYASRFTKEDERRAIQAFFGRAHKLKSVSDI